jgi:hypothetical protein
MNARLYDPRLPGGNALGKITSVKLTGDGDKGTLIGNVTIGCAVGYGNAIAPSIGTPSYVDDDMGLGSPDSPSPSDGYVDAGYQYYNDAVVVLPAGDIGYSIPEDAPFDDGLILTSPLTKGDVILVETLHGSSDAQAALITAAFSVSRYLADYGAPSSYAEVISNANLSFSSVPDCLRNAGTAGAVWYELQLKPVVNGPFTAEYLITLTNLAVPKMIDLEAHST